MEQSIRFRTRRLGIAVLVMSMLVVAESVGPPSAASANSPRERKVGACTGSSTWKLIVDSSGGKLGVVFKIIRGPSKARWTIFLDDNGSGFFAGSRTANNKGRVTVRENTSNLPGPDLIGAAASNRSTGETCVGALIY